MVVEFFVVFPFTYVYFCQDEAIFALYCLHFNTYLWLADKVFIYWISVVVEFFVVFPFTYVYFCQDESIFALYCLHFNTYLPSDFLNPRPPEVFFVTRPP